MFNAFAGSASAYEMLLKLVICDCCSAVVASWFVSEWRDLAHSGMLDDFDGVQCRRVICEWAVDGCPVNSKYLVEHGNIPSPAVR